MVFIRIKESNLNKVINKIKKVSAAVQFQTVYTFQIAATELIVKSKKQNEKKPKHLKDPT